MFYIFVITYLLILINMNENDLFFPFHKIQAIFMLINTINERFFL
jgi:hypothetical protein